MTQLTWQQSGGIKCEMRIPTKHTYPPFLTIKSIIFKCQHLVSIQKSRVLAQAKSSLLRLTHRSIATSLTSASLSVALQLLSLALLCCCQFNDILTSIVPPKLPQNAQGSETAHINKQISSLGVLSNTATLLK